MLTKKIRVRKNSYELICELIYRLELNLLGKRAEFGSLTEETKSDLSNLLVCLRNTRTSILTNCIKQDNFNTRSQELSAIIEAIEMLKDAQVLEFI